MDDLSPFAITPKVQSFLSRVTTFINELNSSSSKFNTKFETLVRLLLEPVDKKDIEVVDKEKNELIAKKTL